MSLEYSQLNATTQLKRQEARLQISGQVVASIILYQYKHTYYYHLSTFINIYLLNVDNELFTVTTYYLIR